MIRIYLYIICILLAVSCKKKEEVVPVYLKKFMIYERNAPMQIELSWTADGITEGEKYVNLDLYLSDTSLMDESDYAKMYSLYFPTGNDLSPIYMYAIEQNKAPEILVPSITFDPPQTRQFLGVTFNGLTDLGKSLNKSIQVAYTIKISTSNEDVQYFNGSFIVNPSLEEKTIVYFISTVDILNYPTFYGDVPRNIYSFRELVTPKIVSRTSDYTFENTITPLPFSNPFTFDFHWDYDMDATGYKKADLDFFIIQYPAGKIYSSQQKDDFEKINVSDFSISADKFRIGYTYYKDLIGSTSPKKINYTYTIYSQSNPFKRYKYSGSFFTYPQASGKTIYFDLAFIYEFDQLRLEELKEQETLIFNSKK